MSDKVREDGKTEFRRDGITIVKENTPKFASMQDFSADKMLEFQDTILGRIAELEGVVADLSKQIYEVKLYNRKRDRDRDRDRDRGIDKKKVVKEDGGPIETKS